MQNVERNVKTRDELLLSQSERTAKLKYLNLKLSVSRLKTPSCKQFETGYLETEERICSTYIGT